MNLDQNFPNNNLSIIISSCDDYSDLWNPCLKMFNKFWNDCPYRKYLLCETKSESTNPELKNFNIKVININSNYWSERLIKALDAIQSNYVLLYLDDFFLKGKVNTDEIKDLFARVVKSELNMLRLLPRPGPKYYKKVDKIGLLDPEDRFYVSTQASIWKKDVLKTLLKKEENIWEFEENGSLRATGKKKFYSVYKSVIPYIHHDIERGKWFPWSYIIFKKYLINDKRKILGPIFLTKFIIMKLMLPIFRVLKILK